MNKEALRVNNMLGYDLYNTNIVNRLELNKISKATIKKDLIDDLIDVRSMKPTQRLIKFTNEILGNDTTC